MSTDQTRIDALEQRLSQVQHDLDAATAHNQRLVQTLREARDQIVTLKDEVDKLAEPPAGTASTSRRSTTAASTSSAADASCASA